MIQFVLGPSGSGKTKWLIDQANDDLVHGHGNYVFIDVDDSHIFSLDHGVRLINAKDFHISSTESLYGFLCGIISNDYDIEKIYLDAIYEIIPYDADVYEGLYKALEVIGKEYDVSFFFGLDQEIDALPELLRKNVVVLKA